MMTIDDDMLMAFVDGELDEVSRARVERAAQGQTPASQDGHHAIHDIFFRIRGGNA